MIRVAAALAGIFLLAGGYIFLHPETPPLRPAYQGVMEPLDERTGLYRMADGAMRLVVPHLDSGFSIHAVDQWAGAPRFISDGALFVRDDQRLEFFEGKFVVTTPDGVRVGMRVEPQPYSLSEITAENGVRLQGWLFRPATPNGVGAVILHGSGDSDRTNSWYSYFAHQLATAGITVVLPDKRGSGRSGGDWRAESFDVLASDGAALMESLRALEPNLSAYGFIGVSQGGFYAPVAAKLASAQFAAALSSSATTLRKQLDIETRNNVAAAGVPDMVAPIFIKLFAARARGRYPAFWKHNGDFDMIARWREWGGPFFIAYGERDELDNTPVILSAARLSAEFDGAENPTWRVYDGADHGLIVEGDRFSSPFMADFLTWTADQGAVARR